MRCDEIPPVVARAAVPHRPQMFDVPRPPELSPAPPAPATASAVGSASLLILSGRLMPPGHDQVDMLPTGAPGRPASTVGVWALTPRAGPCVAALAVEFRGRLDRRGAACQLIRGRRRNLVRRPLHFFVSFGWQQQPHRRFGFPGSTPHLQRRGHGSGRATACARSICVGTTTSASALRMSRVVSLGISGGWGFDGASPLRFAHIACAPARARALRSSLLIPLAVSLPPLDASSRAASRSSSSPNALPHPLHSMAMLTPYNMLTPKSSLPLPIPSFFLAREGAESSPHARHAAT